MCSFALFSSEMPIILPENHGNIFASLWLPIKVNAEYANRKTKKVSDYVISNFMGPII